MPKKISLTFSLGLLILANSLPIYGVFQEKLGAQEAVFFYWFELVIIGLFGTLKILFTKDPLISKQRKIELISLFSIASFVFFIFSAFIIVTTLDFAPSLRVVLLSAGAFILSHGISFIVNFLVGKEYLNTPIKKQFYYPIPRFAVIVIVFFFLSQSTSPNFFLGLSFMIFLKIIADVIIHLEEHDVRIVIPALEMFWQVADKITRKV